MKLHQVLATAVVTTALSPLALLAAPAASASPASASGPAPAATTASATPTAAPSATATADGKASAAPSADPSTVQSPSASASAPASPDAGSAKADDTEPTCSGIPDEERGKTSLRGLPSEIVAGSGWHDFTYRVTNVSDVKVLQTVVSLYLGTADPDLDDIAQLAVTVEWRNPGTGAWKAIEGGDAGALDNYDFAAVKALAPGEYADAEMRIQVGADAEPGDGYFFTNGYSYGEDGECGFDDISQFDFEVLPADSAAGSPGDAEAKPGDADHLPGKGTNAPAPQGDRAEIPVSGKLAETGSPSTLPTVAAVGAAAVVVGAGAVVVVRRRRAGSAA